MFATLIKITGAEPEVRSFETWNDVWQYVVNHKYPGFPKEGLNKDRLKEWLEEFHKYNTEGPHKGSYSSVYYALGEPTTKKPSPDLTIQVRSEPPKLESVYVVYDPAPEEDDDGTEMPLWAVFSSREEADYYVAEWYKSSHRSQGPLAVKRMTLDEYVGYKCFPYWEYTIKGDEEKGAGSTDLLLEHPSALKDEASVTEVLPRLTKAPLFQYRGISFVNSIKAREIALKAREEHLSR
jgi:hypothetical protein